MPEINIDDTNWESYKQCEIRRPSEKGYYFDIIWIPIDIARKNNCIIDNDDYDWIVHEVYGNKKMPGGRKSFRQK